jgi:hypothetical protein
MARAAALLLVLYAAGPAVASRSPATLQSFADFGRSLLQGEWCGLPAIMGACSIHDACRWHP